MTFGEKVKTVRIQLFLTQAAMAQILGVTEQTVRRWERELNEPVMSVQKRFYDYCKTNRIKFEEK